MITWEIWYDSEQHGFNCIDKVEAATFEAAKQQAKQLFPDIKDELIVKKSRKQD